ncbi:MAG: hypothetical protein AAF497_24490 [Planctomycetota bacterium]
MKPKYNNPAGRLLAIVEAAEASKQNVPHAVWRDVFNCSDDNMAVRMMAEVHVLIADLEADVVTHTEQPKTDLYLGFVSKVKTGLVSISHYSGKSWNDVFTSELKVGLECCAADLPTEQEIKKQEIDEIYDDLHSLMKTIRDSDLPKHLKKWLMTLLSSAKEAMDTYAIHGSRAFKKALDSIVGDCCLYQKTFPELESKGVLQRLRSFAGKVAGVASRAKRYEPLLQYAVKGTKLLTQDDGAAD